METNPKPEIRSSSWKRIRLRYPGECAVCGKKIEPGTDASYDRTSRAIRCTTCADQLRGRKDQSVAGSTAGTSAHREYERRKAARETRIKGMLGDFLGGVALALAGEPQSTVAWESGSVGERKLAAVLEGIAGVRVLNDRQVKGTSGNIDHIVVNSAGVFVIDAKHYKGLIGVRNTGGWLSSDERLFVGNRDCTALVTNMAWQVNAVTAAIRAAGPQFATTPVQAVLCFVDGEWPLLFPPTKCLGVRLEGDHSIKRVLAQPGALDASMVDELSHVLGRAFPPK